MPTVSGFVASLRRLSSGRFGEPPVSRRLDTHDPSEHFGAIVRQVTPVRLLTEIFSVFDEITSEMGQEKTKTNRKPGPSSPPSNPKTYGEP